MNQSAKQPPTSAVDETLDTFVVSDSSSSGGDARPKVALVAGPGPRLSVETASLLRRRLRVAALLLLIITMAYLLRAWLRLEELPIDSGFVLLYRVLVLVILIISTGLLWSPWPLSTVELRSIELAMFGVLGTLFVLLHFTFLQIIPDPAPIFEVKYRVGLITIMWYGLIVIYGTFIPNTVLRGAAVIGVMSLAPIGVVTIEGLISPHIGEVVFMEELNLVISVMAIAFTTSLYGMYKLGALRREAFEARQLGQYRLTDRIGSGGMGEVYLAEHQMLKRPCAVKLIHSDSEADSQALARFEREVRLMAKLTHWNSVEIFDYGRTDDGTFYYAMEYLPGFSLQEVVERQGPLQPERAVHLLRQVCQALAEAHALGLVHRDIKPSNIIASKRGGVCDVAKLLDFGLATSAGEFQEIRLTQEGAIAGSPYYLAPERFLDNVDSDVRIDVYSLGAVAYFLLTGQPPFRADQPLQVMMAHARLQVVPPSQLNRAVPSDLEAVVLRCLAKDPAERFQNISELEKALAACGVADQWTQELAARWWTGRDEPASAAPHATASSTAVSSEPLA